VVLAEALGRCGEGSYLPLRSPIPPSAFSFPIFLSSGEPPPYTLPSMRPSCSDERSLTGSRLAPSPIDFFFITILGPTPPSLESAALDRPSRSRLFQAPSCSCFLLLTTGIALFVKLCRFETESPLPLGSYQIQLFPRRVLVLRPNPQDGGPPFLFSPVVRTFF